MDSAPPGGSPWSRVPAEGPVSFTIEGNQTHPSRLILPVEVAQAEPTQTH